MPPPEEKRRKSILEKTQLSNAILLREFMSEFLGTFVLVMIGDGTVAGIVLNLSSGGEAMLLAACGYSAGYILATLVSGGVSGGHINPAVTLAYCITGQVSWKQLPIYWLAQYSGAFLGSAIVYGIHYEAIVTYEAIDRNKIDTAVILTTFPKPSVGYPTAYFDQVLGSMIMMICFEAIADRRNMKIPRRIAPVMIGLTMFCIFLGVGFNCGTGCNPARDLAPRLFGLIFYNADMLMNPRGLVYWWIPFVAPHVGTVLGGLIYLAFIMYHHVREEDLIYQRYLESTRTSLSDEETAKRKVKA